MLCKKVITPEICQMQRGQFVFMQTISYESTFELNMTEGERGLKLFIRNTLAF